MARSFHAQVTGQRDLIIPELKSLRPVAQHLPEEKRNLDLDNFADWTKDATVCDPWRNSRE